MLANHTRICCYVLYCMFQGIICERTHGYVVHVSDAECRVYQDWFMYTMSGRVFLCFIPWFSQIRSLDDK